MGGEMGGAWGTYGGEKKFTQGCGTETWIIKTRPRWEDNMKMRVKEIGLGLDSCGLG